VKINNTKKICDHVIVACYYFRVSAKKVSNKPLMVRSISVTFAADKSKLKVNLLVKRGNSLVLQHHQIAGTPLESKLLSS
jgi:hypothetical protein